MSKDPKEKLISDEEFADLMAAEYEQQQQPVDEVAKERVWKEIEKETKAKPVLRKSKHLWGIAASLIVLVISFPVIQLMYTEETDLLRPKGELAPMAVELLASSVNDNNELESINNTVKPGQRIVFRSKTTQPGWIALGLSHNNQSPEIKFVSSEPVVGTQFLTADENVYAYLVEHEDKQLRFCALVSSDKEQLLAQVDQLTRLWQELPSGACIVLNRGEL